MDELELFWDGLFGAMRKIYYLPGWPPLTSLPILLGRKR